MQNDREGELSLSSSGLHKRLWSGRMTFGTKNSSKHKAPNIQVAKVRKSYAYLQTKKEEEKEYGEDALSIKLKQPLFSYLCKRYLPTK